MIALVAVLGIYLLHKVPGQLEVELLCNRDGGVKVLETTFVDGYYDLWAQGFCGTCIDKVALRQIAWLGLKVDPKVYGLPGEIGYYRLVIDDAGSERCSKPATRLATRRERVNAKQLALDPAKCIALQHDGPKQSGHTFELRSSKIPSRWHNPVALLQARIVNIDSGRLLAEYRGYSYTSTVAKVFDFGSHIGEPDATCSDSLRVDLLKDQVLRDPSKQARASL